MNRKFESHLTIDVAHATIVKRVAELRRLKFSQIDGDALMGDKPYCYVTGYDSDAMTLLKMMAAMERVLSGHGIQVLRTKIEEIVYDTKTGHDVLTGGILQ